MTVGLVIAALPLLWTPAWLLVGTMWVAIVLAVGFDARVLRGARPTLSLTLPSATPVGEPVPIQAGVLCHSRRRLRGTLRFEVEAPIEAPKDAPVSLEPGTVEHEVALEAPRRGEGAVRAVWLRVLGPLQTLEWIRRVPVDRGRIAVLPNTRRLARLLQMQAARPLHRIGHRLALSHGEGTEFDSLQAYVAGMDTRQIDWKSSARYHSLRARRYRQERDQRIVLCLDTGRLMQAPIDRLQRLDHAIHTALLLASVALRGRDLVGLHAYGASPGAWVQPASGGHQQARLARACAGLEAENAETNHALGLHSVLHRLSRRCLIVVFTDFTDSTMAELMIEYLQQLARRHLVLFVALDDPIVEQPWRTPPTDVERMASAVMTSELRRARHVVLRELEISGVRVVHGEPGEAALAVLQQYLDIKRRGLLG